jgi:uncharacterized protein (DUF983 family)
MTTSLTSPHSATSAPPDEEKRPVGQALKRGFRELCPRCGQGHMFKSYLKVNTSCAVCGEELHHHRADDAPPYITIFVVGHIIGTLMLAVEEINDAIPLWIHALVWPVLTIILTLALLPRFKGALIGYQWALKMHGFDPHHIQREDNL